MRSRYWMFSLVALLGAALPQSDAIFVEVRQAWEHFVNTGQAWALAIGFLIGYVFSRLSSYG